MFSTLCVFQKRMSALKLDAPRNIASMCVARAVFHEPMSPLKASAYSNICVVSSTLCRFQLLISPLKTEAPRNMRSMLVTLDTSQRRSRLKFSAPKNMLVMSVTLPVFQLPMSLLKLVAPLNSRFMLSTACTSQSKMSPCLARAATSLLSHSLTAALSWSYDVNTPLADAASASAARDLVLFIDARVLASVMLDGEGIALAGRPAALRIGPTTRTTIMRVAAGTSLSVAARDKEGQEFGMLR
mmetsp:Transcript_19710/g.42451  ORF Transcript_19710/g.42451 Transcript_19710/m.42451 type:complete len:242 (-) Transcript_19710:2-727(-)